MNNLEHIFRENNIPFLKNEPLKNWCTFKIGGPAAILVEPANEKDISLVIKETGKAGCPLLVLGRGSNILFSDVGFHGVVLHLGKNMSHMEIRDNNKIYCQGGAKLKDLCLFALEQELTGMEELYGIPGSVGGALYMNAGAYGGETKDVAFSSTFIDLDGNSGELCKDNLNLSYRHSAFSDNNYIITSLTVSLKKGNADEIKAKMDDFMGRRWSKQPLEYASAGSTFKRPPNNFASALIDQCGLKGVSVGDAMVSEKHAGFVINKGSASSKDVITVIEKVKQEVYKQKSVKLECEIKIIN